ncbi:hypothetical protein HMPREF0083_05085 [Aneurinibacillus aneurinilyticus ATCC 12856]|uniref:Uncharacterized protein n=1 Tax=Aneurinibacillus aneurinilyticus ATCC 12856 TaxID=649747 RepID=U1WX78_ANEAE|nr:hypothetical protein HMPREF0083_05085 [Aneurinibacillus aneurinilyticus ATCC 12856]
MVTWFKGNLNQNEELRKRKIWLLSVKGGKDSSILFQAGSNEVFLS